MTNTKIEALDGLRGWMAFWVWVSHVTTMAALPLEKTTGLGWILANGEFAVAVFVVLSGFVISMTLTEPGGQATSAFYVRRGFRLFPAYLVCLLISAFLTLDLSITALEELPWYTTRTADRLVYLHNSRNAFWTHLSLHVPLLHGIVPERFLPSTSYAFMGQAWSLTLEWQFYLFAPFAIVFMRRFEWTPLRQTALLFALGLLARRLPQPSMLPSNLYLFAIGYFSYEVYRQRGASQLTASRFALHVAVWALGATLVSYRSLAIPLWATVLYAIMRTTPPRPLLLLRQCLCSPLSTGLGAISYGFYCCHMFSIFSCAYLLLVVLGVRDHTLYAGTLIASSLVMSLAVSIALRTFVERPCIAMGRRLAAALAATPRELVAKG
jgi:peptidoglycan/LPS O-acetylase OafA/YrhL